jgi:hypothetical protein
MLSVAHNRWTHPDQSSCPQLQCSRAADASGLAHQITDSSSHSFYAACSRWQIKLRIFAIGSELIGSSEKLPDYHAHNARAHWVSHELLQPLEHRFQAWTVRQLQRLASKPVEGLSHGPAYQFAFSSSSAPLQLTDEMKMTQLHDPALSRSQPDDPPNVVGDRGTDVPAYPGGNRSECLRPTPHILPAGKKQRVEERCSILMAWFDTHQVQDPMLSSKPKVQSVENQDQRPCWQPQSTRLGNEALEGLMKTITQCSRREVASRGEGLQRPPSNQHCSQNSRGRSPALAAPFFLADTPRTLAMVALSTSRSKAMNFGSATTRFRVRRIHARELATK